MTAVYPIPNEIKTKMCAEMKAVADNASPKKFGEQGFQRSVACATHSQKVAVDNKGAVMSIEIGTEEVYIFDMKITKEDGRIVSKEGPMWVLKS